MRKRYCLLTLLVLLLDHATKWLISVKYALHEGTEIIPDYLRIVRVHNSGVAFGIFADLQLSWKPAMLALMAVIAVVVIVIYSLRMPSSRTLLQAALAITLGGILGNFLDRIMHGFVVDFIEFHIRESFYWPTFNVADSAITIGIALLLIDTVKNPDEPAAANA